MSRPDAKKERVIVVGNGMVGHRFCESVVSADAGERFELVVFGDEPRPAYDRVQLTKYFTGSTAEDLQLAGRGWYSDNGIELRTGERVTRIDPAEKVVETEKGTRLGYEHLVLATGSYPFVPPIPGIEKEGVFVYRTIEDLDAIIEYGKSAKSAAVIGGGLLGLEAAKAVKELGLDTHVVEMASHLMPRQLDSAGARLLLKDIQALGVGVHLSKQSSEIVGDGKVAGIAFADGARLPVDMLVVSAGIKPRDDLAREAKIAIGNRGGIVVDDALRTSAEDVYAIGEVALHQGTIYGLVAPGYDMAEVLVQNLVARGTETGTEEASFKGGDLSAKLKLLGTDVANFGEHTERGDQRTIIYEDLVKGVYKKLVVSNDAKQLIGGVLVGDAAEYTSLLHYAVSGDPLPVSPDELILGSRGGAAGGALPLPDGATVCSCNGVTKGAICKSVQDGALTPVDVKKCTKAGAGCGGCLPLVTDLVNAELKSLGKVVKPRLCEHFDFTRQELFEIVRVKHYRSFAELLETHGSGNGCEVCKPTVASILASIHNDVVVDENATLQDTNDRFLANIQRQGTYSVVPRIPGGEITPDKLIVIGQVAKKYGLYTKITGGQRIDLFGAQVNQLPNIWEELVNAGFESGHAYGKALRTVKSCVGSTWCRYGVQNSVGFAVRVEERYRGVRSPHKMKSAVSGCVRECAEAQSKDFGLIATEQGWNLYVGGNGGANPRHADLLVSDVDEETVIKYIDRFLMFYIRTADKLMRTAPWLDKLEGGLEHLKDVVIHDSLGICDQLEADMQHLVDTYQCEWKAVVENPKLRAKFKHFANSNHGDDTLSFVDERGQRRPADWVKSEPPAEPIRLPVIKASNWVKVASVNDVPVDGGIAVEYGDGQIALYNFASRGEWFATQNACPHRNDQVLARGIVGDHKGTPKVACPMHRKSFSLKTGECLSGESYAITTFPVKIEGENVYVELPPPSELAAACTANGSCSSHTPVAAE
jgi:nitrite reductase (NADH) large subunit